MQPHKINPSDKKLLSDTLLDHILNVSMEELSYAPIKNGGHILHALVFRGHAALGTILYLGQDALCTF